MRGNTSVGFCITDHKGFTMTFENGWTVSVQWGPGSYCDHCGHCGPYGDYDAPKRADIWQSATAEIAAWNSAGRWYNFTEGTVCDEGDTDVKGYLSADEVVGYIALFASLPR